MYYVLTFSEGPTTGNVVSTTVAHAYPKPHQTPNSNVEIAKGGNILYTSLLTFLKSFNRS